MPKTHHCSLEVRGYELDSFGHVNHATYISYLEHARWKFLADENVGLPQLEAWKAWPVIAHLEATYLKPTYLGDALEVRTVLAASGRTGFTAEQTIYRGDVAVMKGIVKIVMVNENGRPTEVPTEFSRLLKDL